MGNNQWEDINIPANKRRFHNTDVEFIQAIITGKQISPDFKEGLEYMKFIEAVAISIKKGNIVSVPPKEEDVESWDDI